MKITELTCTACGGSLKVDEKNPWVAECEYCHTRYTLEGDRGLVQQPAKINYTPYTPEKPKKTGWKPGGIKRVFAVGVLVFVLSGAMFGPGIYRRYQADQLTKAGDAAGAAAEGAVGEAAAEGAAQADGLAGALASGENGQALDALSALRADPLLSAFCEAVFRRPVEELTEKDLSQIRQLSISSTLDTRRIGYSMEEPEAEEGGELTWEVFSRDEYSDADLSCLPAFTGLVRISVSQRLKEGDLAGLRIRSLQGYFDSLTEAAALVDDPAALEEITAVGSTLDLTGIEALPGLKRLTVNGELTDGKMLVQGQGIEALALNDRELAMDFSVLATMPELKELSLASENLRDIGFVSGIPKLTSLSLSNGTMLNLDALQSCTGLEALSIESCDEIKDLSAVSALTELKRLRLDLPYGCPEPDLSGLTQMEELTLEGFQEMRFLTKMNGLLKLTLDSCPVSDFSVFSGLTSLKSLTCTSFGAAERDYRFIPQLTSLEEVNLSGTSTYGDISGIFNLPALKRLNIGGMSAEIAFDRIGENTVLEELNMDHMKLYKNVVISGGGGIVSVNWDDVSLVDHLDFFSRLKGLKHLSIRENELTDLSFAGGLGMLETIDFSDNYVTDVSPLSALQNLKQVTGTDNPVSNYETLGAAVTVVR